ncbi:MAG: glycosyl hydrolase family 8 [Liquorilactobacillus satsumensis]
MLKNKGAPFVALIILSFIILGCGVLYMHENPAVPKVHSLFEQWHSKYIKATANGNYVNGALPQKKATALSESQGYGMLVTIQAAQKGWATQHDFNRLVTYYLNHQINAQNHLMAWKQTKEGNSMVTAAKNNVSATDGDLDIAYSLLQADSFLGSTGKVNYQQLAHKILNSLLRYTYQRETNLLTVGDWALNSPQYSKLIRTSDLIPAYYQYFYRKTKNQSWKLIAKKSVAVLNTLSAQNKTGLLPDFAYSQLNTVSGATPYSLEGANDDNYAWNATRIPWRLALNNSQVLQKINKKLLSFFAKQSTIHAGYTLSGKQLVPYSSMAFTAPIAVAAMQNSKQFAALSAATKKSVLNDKLTGNYYADTLQVLSAFSLENMGEDNE